MSSLVYVLFCVWEVGWNTKGKWCALNVDQGSFQDLKKGAENYIHNFTKEVTY